MPSLKQFTAQHITQYNKKLQSHDMSNCTNNSWSQ